jgi:threonine synthase
MELKCSICGTPPDRKAVRCKCGGPIEISYNYSKINPVFPGVNIWRFIPLLPVEKPGASMHEGWTPLFESDKIGQKLGGDLWFKKETINPTGSFKDRGSVIEITKAQELGMSRVVCASTGNMGASVSAYAARASLGCRIILPKWAAREKVTQMKLYGSDVQLIDGTYDDAVKLAIQEAEKDPKTMFCGDYHWRREGQKTIAFEIAEWMQPEYVFCPVGNGTLMAALWKGFWEFKKLGIISKIPKLIGVQAEGCSPVARAFSKKEPLNKWPKSTTLASAIDVTEPSDAHLAMRAAKDSGGDIISVTDNEIMFSLAMLARDEGIFAEPGGAASLAGYLKLRPLERTICLITGHGLNDSQTVRKWVGSR